MNFREIAGKIIGYYRKTPKTQGELDRERDQQILAKINKGKPAKSYLTPEDQKSIDNLYARYYSPLEVKSLKERLNTLPDDLREH